MTKLVWLLLVALVLPGLWGLSVYLLVGRRLMAKHQWPPRPQPPEPTDPLDYQIWSCGQFGRKGQQIRRKQR